MYVEGTFDRRFYKAYWNLTDDEICGVGGAENVIQATQIAMRCVSHTTTRKPIVGIVDADERAAGLHCELLPYGVFETDFRDLEASLFVSDRGHEILAAMLERYGLDLHENEIWELTLRVCGELGLWRLVAMEHGLGLKFNDFLCDETLSQYLHLERGTGGLSATVKPELVQHLARRLSPIRSWDGPRWRHNVEDARERLIGGQGDWRPSVLRGHDVIWFLERLFAFEHVSTTQFKRTAEDLLVGHAVLERFGHSNQAHAIDDWLDEFE